MGTIHLLDSDTINQIAAGEVVERPASVVKELVENAIDAGARAITVEIKEGGIGLIRVTDNGSGIAKEDIKAAFFRHATSKISTALDLLCVKSLGFRGEALSSIAAVSMVELVTKTRAEFTGSRYVIEGGQEKELSETGVPEGTTFLVRSLFYNIPARRKFLKTATTEAGYISDLMERFAIAHPEISFKFINNGKNILQTAGNGNLKDCIYHVFGRDVAAALLPVETKAGSMEMEGFVGKPVIMRGNRNHENYFINGRHIKSNIISKAIEEAYKPYAMQHKYPFTTLHFSIPADAVDVNVHPTKLEVRFTDGEGLYQLVYRAVKDALAGKNMIPDALLTEEKRVRTVYQPTPEIFEHGRITQTKAAVRNEAERVRDAAIEAMRTSPLFSGMENSAPNENSASTGRFASAENLPPTGKFAPAENLPSTGKFASTENLPSTGKFAPAENFPSTVNRTEIKTETGTEVKAEMENNGKTAESPAQLLREDIPYGTQLSLFEAAERTKEAFLDKKQEDHHRIIGQLFATYWLVEFEEQLFIIDQHAAHEKILYEHTVARMKEHGYFSGNRGNDGENGKEQKSLQALSQMLTPPIILALSLREEEVLLHYMEQFTSLGFAIEAFGGREYAISAVPTDLYGVDGRALLLEMLDSLVAEPMVGTPDIILDKIASMSCKAAVKGNMHLTTEEAKALIHELLGLENPFHCPHGRPIIVSMTKNELERKFKRIIH